MRRITSSPWTLLCASALASLACANPGTAELEQQPAVTAGGDDAGADDCTPSYGSPCRVDAGRAEVGIATDADNDNNVVTDFDAATITDASTVADGSMPATSTADAAGASNASVGSIDASTEAPPQEPAPLRNYLPCDVERITAERCRACHSRRGNAVEPLLETWAQVSTEANTLLESVLDDFMPLLPPPLSVEQKAVLSTWIAAGAPPVERTSPPDCW